jgi:hypothetical protein
LHGELLSAQPRSTQLRQPTTMLCAVRPASKILQKIQKEQKTFDIIRFMVPIWQ